MKKLGLLLITLIILTSVSYASFPITDTLQTEEIEPSNSFYIFLSILSDNFMPSGPNNLRPLS